MKKHEIIGKMAKVMEAPSCLGKEACETCSKAHGACQAYRYAERLYNSRILPADEVRKEMAEGEGQ